MIQSLRRRKVAFGEKLKQLYQSRGLTQKQLAAEIFVSRSAIAKWDTGAVVHILYGIWAA